MPSAAGSVKHAAFLDDEFCIAWTDLGIDVGVVQIRRRDDAALDSLDHEHQPIALQ